MLQRSDWLAFCANLSQPLDHYLPSHVNASHRAAQLVTNSSWFYRSDPYTLQQELVCRIDLLPDQDKMPFDFKITVNIPDTFEARLVLGNVILDSRPLQGSCTLMPIPMPIQRDLCHVDQSKQLRLELITAIADPMTMPLPDRILIDYALLYVPDDQAQKIRSSIIFFDKLAYKKGRIVTGR